MSNPAISVIIPVYNAEQYLRRCVDSVLAQSYTDFELLLIDDGSRDQSPAICDEYAVADARVQVFHQPNGGVSSARNLGLDHARGQWITFIDSDDFISPNYLSAVNRSDADLLILNKRVNHIRGGYSEVQCLENYTGQLPLRQYLGENLHLHLLRVPWGKIFKKALFTNHRFRLNQTIGEDTLLIYQLLPDVKSIATLTGHIYYWQERDDDIKRKYAIPAKASANYISAIYNSYAKLQYENMKLEQFLLHFFFMLISHKRSSELQQFRFSAPAIQQIESHYALHHIPFDVEYRYYRTYRQLAPTLLLLRRCASKLKHILTNPCQK